MSSPASLTAAAALASTATRLTRAGVEPALREAEWLLLYILDTTRAVLYSRSDRELTDSQARLLSTAVSRRCARVPLQHILGDTEFYGLRFMVSPGVLIPRPETETLVENVVDEFKQRDHPSILDVGTGSGAIAIAVAGSLPSATCVATDLSREALSVAASNVRLNGVSDRVRLVRADLLSAFRPGRPFDALVSNPPYIASGDIPGLQPEVRDHDPLLALDGGPDGYRFYRTLLPKATHMIRAGGLLALEIGDGQGDTVAAMVQDTGAFSDVRVLPDLSSHDRVVLARRTAD
jgi:release factor glutamine methyltransferase